MVSMSSHLSVHRKFEQNLVCKYGTTSDATVCRMTQSKVKVRDMICRLVSSAASLEVVSLLTKHRLLLTFTGYLYLYLFWRIHSTPARVPKGAFHQRRSSLNQVQIRT